MATPIWPQEGVALDSTGDLVAGSLGAVALGLLSALPLGANHASVKSLDLSGGAGAIGTINLFYVTGPVFLLLVGWCTEDLVGAATIEVGIAGATAALLAQVANATTVDADMAWFADNAPSDMEVVSTYGGAFFGGDKTIILTIGGAEITDGELSFSCFWTPLDTTGNVAAV